MFERRVLILIVLLSGGLLALVGRAAQMQLGQRGQWEAFVTGELNRSELVETIRGRILDRRGRVLAKDEPCIDARVHYAALTEPPDPEWVKWTAYRRCKQDESFADADRPTRAAWWEAEERAVVADLAELWDVLAEAGGMSRADVDAARREIVERVEGRRDYLARRRYRAALDEWEAGGRPAWWRRWLLGEGGEPPAFAEFDEPIEEEQQAHILVRDLSQAAQNRLEKLAEQLPGLTLRPGMRRVYPHGPIAAHLVGRLAKVMREDLDADPAADDRLRRYLPNDLIGREGLEALAEAALRGGRGSVYHVRLNDEVQTEQRQEPTPGRDVAATIDLDVQTALHAAFGRVLSPNRAYFGGDEAVEDYVRKPMPGAAVALDVETGQVLAMVSAPAFDPNTFDDDYNKLIADAVNLPLLNRATLVPREVGSTMKVITGVGGIAGGVLGPDERIECTGFLRLPWPDPADPVRQFESFGKCWTMHYFGHGHHDIPLDDPHPTGFLRFDEALQRSCNVFFETVGDRLRLAGLDEWQRAFGLGEPTGVGLPERPGRTSGDFAGDPTAARSEAWFNAMGQGEVQATPLQMAAAAAAVARRGQWVRPTLLDAASRESRHIDAPPAAWELAWRGMEAVVHTPAGTGTRLDGLGFRVAAKTGSATSVPLRVRDANGAWRPVPFAPTNLLTDADDQGTVADRTAGAEAPWYHAMTNSAGTEFRRDEKTGDLQPDSHGWCVGFAPADDPKVAFAVIVDYGGSGGKGAADVAAELLAALRRAGYL